MELEDLREKVMNTRVTRDNLDEYAAMMGVDLTLIARNLRLTPTERLRNLQAIIENFTPLTGILQKRRERE